MGHVWTILLLVLVAALLFLFSGMEAGVFALSRLRIRQQMRAGSASARILHQFLEQPEQFLWTILVGSTLAEFLLVGLTFLYLHRWLAGGVWLWLALAAGVFLIYALADLLPKMLFRQYSNRLCLGLARLFRITHLTLAPLVAIVAWLAEVLLKSTGGHRFTGRLFANREELRHMMQESSHALSKEERTMVNRVLDLQNLTVGAVGTPLSKVVTVTTTTPITEVFKVCRETGLNRMPVKDPANGRIVGIVTLRNSLYQHDLDERKPVGTFLQPALYLEESARLEVALQRLRQSGQRIAIVLDRNRKEAGIVTLHDILRHIFGEVSW
ncbi:MAG TPA: CNNM domain-containing protein [Verrucomicrobiota bacterium]|nr:CNNM domain-containing protein [Verrucomicrobiota bacterium]